MMRSDDLFRAGSTWTVEPHLLLEAARHGAASARAVPEVPGYAGLVLVRRGGQGVIYKARERATGRVVAIKLLIESSDVDHARRRRFEREIEIVASLRHEGIVQAIGSGVTEDGRLFLAMEWLDGPSLQDLLRAQQARAGLTSAQAPSGRLVRCVPHWGEQQALEFFLLVGAAVDAAHRQGILHRDLKPSNIMVVEGRPRILDFGVSSVMEPREREGRATTLLTLSDQFIGSLPWASPEQLDPTIGPIDVRSDVYALGGILYELVTGRPPFEVATTLPRLVGDILGTQPVPPSRRAESRSVRGGHHAAQSLDAIVLRCLAKAPAHRYQSVAEVTQDVRRHLRGDAVEALREHQAIRLRSALRRARRGLRLAAAVAAVLALGAGLLLHLANEARSARVSAEEQSARIADERDRARALAGMLHGLIDASDPSLANRPDATVRTLMAAWQAELRQRVDAPPAVRVPALIAVGRAAHHLGLPAEADALLTEALALMPSARGRADGDDDHQPDLADARREALRVLGLSRHALGRLVEAEDLIRQAIEASEATLGDGDHRTAHMRIDLATVLGARGRLDEAQVLLEAIVRDACRRWGRPSEVVGVASLRLAEVAQGRGMLEDADAMYEQAHAELRGALGSGSLPLADCLERWASLRVDQGRSEAAMALASEALEIYRRRLGSDHWLCAGTLVTLADAARAGSQRFADGEALADAWLAEASRIVDPVLPKGHQLCAGIRERTASAGSLPSEP